MSARISIVAAGILCLATAAVAQEAHDPAPAGAAQPSPTAASPTEPASGNPDLSVATVKMDGGTRASHIIGATVNDSAGQSLGTVNDLILDPQGKAVLGVVMVGGVLGVGGKLVAVPFKTLHVDGSGKVSLPGQTKDSLNKMPGFTYNN